MPLSALQSKVRKAVPEQLQSVICRSMPELRQVSKQHGIPLHKTFSPDCCSGTLYLSPYLSFPGRQRHGQTGTYYVCTVSPGITVQAEKVPLTFARQTDVYPTRSGVPFIISILTPSIPVKPVVPFYPDAAVVYFSWPFLLSPAIGFIRCKCTLSRLIRRLEVHFLQNSSLPVPAKSNLA